MECKMEQMELEKKLRRKRRFFWSRKYKEQEDNIWRRKIFQEGKYLWMDCCMYTEGKGRNEISDLASDEKNITEGFRKQVKIWFKTRKDF